eukprot:m.15847 g.15847  ORF g.15847 m.15847 type:complete len:730 (+) comp26581_c0_seq2:406-2595(+)
MGCHDTSQNDPLSRRYTHKPRERVVISRPFTPHSDASIALTWPPSSLSGFSASYRLVYAFAKAPDDHESASVEADNLPALRRRRNGTGWSKEGNAMSEHVAYNIVSELFDDEYCDDYDSGNGESFTPPSPLDHDQAPGPQPWSWWSETDSSFQHLAASYETPLGSISSSGSISSGDSALAGGGEQRTRNPWQQHYCFPRPGESEKPPSTSAPVSAGSSPPPLAGRSQSSAQTDTSPAGCFASGSSTTFMKAGSSTAALNRHSYPKVGPPTSSANGSSQIKVKQPLLATPIIHNGMVSKDPPRFYRPANGGHKGSPGYPPSRFMGRPGYSSCPSSANWQYTIHEGQTKTNYGQHTKSYGSSSGGQQQQVQQQQQYGPVMLRFNDRQNRPPRLANKSRRFSDGVLYTGQQDGSSSESMAGPPELNGQLNSQPFVSPSSSQMQQQQQQQQHLYPPSMARVKLRKGAALVGRSHSFNHSPRNRQHHLMVPKSSTPGSSSPLHHEQRMQQQQGYSTFPMHFGYSKGFRPHSAPNPFLSLNGHPMSQYDPSRPKASHELHIRIESCMEETKGLVQERRRAETELVSQGFLLPRGNSLLSIPRLPPNPTRLDKLVNDQFREHAKMEAFASHMERHHRLLPGEFCLALDSWGSAIQDLYMRRQDEREALSDPSRRNQWDENEVLGLAASAEDLLRAISTCRMMMMGDHALIPGGLGDMDQVEQTLSALCLQPDGRIS